MRAFVWDDHFVTGLDEVDRQHKELVDLINRLGNQLAEVDWDQGAIHEVIEDLTRYTSFHFREEELMMITAGLYQEHLGPHIASHYHFLEEVSAMRANISVDNPTAGRHLLDFLSQWLAYHILGTDQNMSRQVHAVQSGIPAREAFENEERATDSATGPLLVALNGLFRQVSLRNKELVEFNRTLEEKVELRTQELYQANQRLEKISSTDVLTGLPNRRHAMIRLESMWQESESSQTPLSCLMVDADHFKEVNDTYGHDAGDVVLRSLAAALSHNVRTDDVVARLGGDEFLVLCPNTDNDGALQVAEGLVGAVSKMQVPAGDGYWQGSISVGVGFRRPEMTVYSELIKSADNGVYEAKRAGKNCARRSEL